MNQPQNHSKKKGWKEILIGWNKDYSGLLGTISLIITILINVKDGFGGKPKNEFETTLDRMIKEAEERVRAKQAAEMYEKELKTTRELNKECNNEVQQLDTILTLHEITSEDRKIDKRITFQDWMKNDEVKDKIHEISEKRKRCKGCKYCNNSAPLD